MVKDNFFYCLEMGFGLVSHHHVLPRSINPLLAEHNIQVQSIKEAVLC